MNAKAGIPMHQHALRRFAQREDGSMIMLGLIFFTLMIMMGGLAVDLMRFEATRTQLQQTTDRAVLAAASMRQQLDPEDVVEDYFNKAGLLENLKSVAVTETFNAKQVEVVAASDVDPFFMQMLGIDEMVAPAAGTAIEKISDVEISMVLDISGSMDSSNRLINLKPAAKEFVDTIFQSAEPDRTTISIIPYSGHVNLGSTFSSVFNLSKVQTNSYCVDLPASTFTSTTISQTTLFNQASHFDPFASSGTKAPSLYFCPPATANTVMIVSDNKTALKAKIDGLDADGNTSIDIGMKWGTTLLDPASNNIVKSMVAKGSVLSKYNDRPLDASTRDVLKVIILMTDGENTEQTVINDLYRSGNSNIYRRTSDGSLAAYIASGTNTYGKYYMVDDNYNYGTTKKPINSKWATQPFKSATGWTQLTWPQVWQYAGVQYVAQKLFADPLAASYTTWMNNLRTASDTTTKNTRLQQICSAAKAKGIVVFTIGFDAPTAGKTQLKACATSSGHYYDVTGLQISTAFRSIASQISTLRLTQ